MARAGVVVAAADWRDVSMGRRHRVGICFGFASNAKAGRVGSRPMLGGSS